MPLGIPGGIFLWWREKHCFSYFRVVTVKKEKSGHPILEDNHSSRQKNGALWNTHADFPVSHLLDLTPFHSRTSDKPVQPVIEEVVQPLPLEMPPAISRIRAMPDVSDLSPFAQWLMVQKPATVDGAPAPALPEIVVPEAPESDKAPRKEKSRSKKNKDKKKRKKKKKSTSGSDKLLGKHGMLETGIVTDILAELAADQGYIKGAISMYRRLVHLHPERTAFYLGRIQALRKEDSEE
jgi:hypothetical protein